MSSSVASGYSSKVGRSHQRKYNIAPELLASPYLSRPIGSFNYGDKRKKRNGSIGGESRKPKSPRRRRDETSNNHYASDVESVVTRTSVTTYRTRDTKTYRRPSQSNAQRMVAMKNFLLPRETDKLLRGFRQRHNNHPFLKHSFAEAHRNDERDDDDSTIVSDSAESLDDEAVYLHCMKNNDVKNTLFSGPLFAEIALRNAGNAAVEGDGSIILPPVVAPGHDKSDDVSDLESLHSSTSKLDVRPGSSQRKRR